MSITEFAQLDFLGKMILIEHDAVLIDTYSEKDDLITTYFLTEFFVEVKVNKHSRFITDIIPYKRGFKQPIESISHSLSA